MSFFIKYKYLYLYCILSRKKFHSIISNLRYSTYTTYYLYIVIGSISDIGNLISFYHLQDLLDIRMVNIFSLVVNGLLTSFRYLIYKKLLLNMMK